MTDVAPLTGPVLVVGAGLLGTSVALALRVRGIEVALEDVNDDHLRTATGLGAASVAAAGLDPQLAVVAVPPDHLARTIADLLRRTTAVVTDVGSIKGAPLAEVARLAPGDLSRYVGGHPMAGSERSGPLAASSTIFDGRPWAVTPHDSVSSEAVALVTALATACGATVVHLGPDEHDAAVARTSHLPHLLASLVAGRLSQAPAHHLALSGQGVRDVTRVAAGDPVLWQQILTANGSALTELLHDVRADVDTLLAALAGGDRESLAVVLERGVDGTAAIPGKHGGPSRRDGTVFVVVPDHPGNLARLFADAGEIGVNVEDVRIDHDPGREFGLLELTVAADAVDHLLASLAERGWTSHR